VSAEELREASLKLAGRITEASPLTVGTGKHAFYSQIELAQPLAYSLTKEVMANNVLRRMRKKGSRRFLRKGRRLGRERSGG
jgi:hypothetical protein